LPSAPCIAALLSAVIWGIPIINYDLMFQAMVRAGGAIELKPEIFTRARRSYEISTGPGNPDGTHRPASQ
jgi:hypothetical protein